jgi:hypothetical protein
MTIDRRSFLYAGGLTVAAAAPLSNFARAEVEQAVKSIADFGLAPDSDDDQTDKLQAAINELSRARQPVMLPSGLFNAAKLSFPSGTTIIGTGHTIIETREITIADSPTGGLTLQGIHFMRGRLAPLPRAPLLTLGKNADITMHHCSFSTSGTALAIEVEPRANLYGVTFRGMDAGKGQTPTGVGISSASNGLTVINCLFEGCASGVVTEGRAAASTITHSEFNRCGIAISASGTGVIQGNTITSARQFGLKLGSAKTNGHIIAQGNLIRFCPIGIGVSSSGDDIMASLNMITGAKDGAIRAFDGDKLVGPDLARQSAEAYLNLMVAGNVVR